jgi:hypothetical protein
MKNFLASDRKYRNKHQNVSQKTGLGFADTKLFAVSNQIMKTWLQRIVTLHPRHKVSMGSAASVGQVTYIHTGGRNGGYGTTNFSPTLFKMRSTLPFFFLKFHLKEQTNLQQYAVKAFEI